MGEPEDGKEKRPHERWAQLRFAVVGRLLVGPPRRGELSNELGKLAEKPWRHPTKGEMVRFGVSTIERWYYKAKKAVTDPVGALARKLRADCGKARVISEMVASLILTQYQQHKSWSYQLHHDNLAEVCRLNSELVMPSYPTLRRYMQKQGWRKYRRIREDRPGLKKAQQRLENVEVRSFEAEQVNGVWHSDFHHGSLPVVLPSGEWVRPLLMAVLDDRSRLACHAQWYLGPERAEDHVHGLSQAFFKRGLCRLYFRDNGGPMIALEVRQGLARLGIIDETTNAESPWENGKQENFWTRVEARLLPMLENRKGLTLALLNEATQAWVEMEYNREKHGETGQTPLQRFLDGPNVGRPCPSAETLAQAFCVEASRRQREGDGTITVMGVRFEVPSRYRHLGRVSIRYTSWDASRVFLVDRQSGTVVAKLLPLDRTQNADGKRRRLEPVASATVVVPAPVRKDDDGVAPLMRRLLADYAATGLPPAYIPKDDTDPSDSEEN